MKLNIQLFASGTITGTSTASIGRVQIIWSSTSKGAVENKSDVTATVQVKRSTAYNTTGTFSGTLWINGVAFSIKKKFDPISNQWKTIDTKTLENVEHNADGSKTIEIKTSFSNTGTSMAGTYTASANVKLDDIPRASLFYSCSIKVNSDSTLTLYHNISKQNTNFIDKLTFCGQEFTIPNGNNSTLIDRNTTAWTTFYNTMGTDTYKEYSAVLRTYATDGTTQIGEDNEITNISGSLNKLDGVDYRTYAINTSNITATDNNASNPIISTNANGTTYTSQHIVSEFTSGTTFLQGWSNPKLASTISIDTANSDNYTFGRPIVLSGISTNSITLDGNSYTENVYLGTGFSADTYKLNATDGRKSATEKSISISQKSWTKPSVKITLTRQSATSQYVDWTLTWSYTSVSRNNGNLNATLFASYTYNGNTTTLVNITSGLATSGTTSGTITLAGEDDYKYPINGNATLVDMIDYKVHSSDYKPGGQPAIYVHKDSSSNNLVDVLGTLDVSGNATIDGTFTTSTWTTENTGDTWVPVWRNGYLEHRTIPTAYNNDPSLLTVGNASQSSRYRGYTTNLNDANQSGWYRWNNEASNHPWSTGWGMVEVENDGWWIFQTAYATYDDEYSRIAHRGYINGDWTSWSYVPTKDYVTPKTLYDDVEGANQGTIYLNESAGNFTYLEIFFWPKQALTDNDRSGWRSVKVMYPNYKKVQLSLDYDSGTRWYHCFSTWYIDGTSLVKQSETRWRSGTGSEAQTRTDTTNNDSNITITQVIGYR